MYRMNSFMQLLNNGARYIAKGCSELVNNFLAITVCGWSKAKKINNNKMIFAHIYLLDIAEVNYFYHHS